MTASVFLDVAFLAGEYSETEAHLGHSQKIAATGEQLGNTLNAIARNLTLVRIVVW